MSKISEQQDDMPVLDLWSKINAENRSLGVAVRRVHKHVSLADFEGAAKSAEKVRGTIERLTQLSNEISVAQRSFRDSADQRFSELESGLRGAIAARNWVVDGSWPSLYVERGVPVEIDEAVRSVKVAGHKTTNPTVKDIMAVLEPMVVGLVPRNFVPQVFMDLLAKAYDDVKGSKSQISVRDVYRGLVLRLQTPQFWKDARTDSFQELTVNQFRARLTRCLEAGCASSTDHRELRILPPLDPHDGIFVYQPAELRFAFVGRLEFLST